MKKRILSHIYFSICTICVLIFSSCDLEIQDAFDFKNIDDEQYTFEETTAWEWLQTNPNNQFDYMIECIKVTGLVDEYNSANLKRTFFLILDIGFTSGSGVFKKEFGNSVPDIDEIEDLSESDIQKLKNILKYNILGEYLEQNSKKILKTETPDRVNTLSEDPNNSYIEIHSTQERYMRMNFYGRNSNKLYQDVRLHNYIFSNGNAVAHITEGHMRLVPFE